MRREDAFSIIALDRYVGERTLSWGRYRREILGQGEVIRKVRMYRSMLVMMGAIRKAVLAAAVASEKIRQGR